MCNVFCNDVRKCKCGSLQVIYGSDVKPEEMGNEEGSL